MDIREIYSNLTSVDIEKQKLLWDERGKGYYGEYLVFNSLYRNISGECKILMNLQIPAANNKSTEIDLLMIHESGFYVFEAKHYKGTIYGKYEDESWTQYFRTQSNSHFHSPIKQNDYHMSALQRLFPDIPVHSFIVFTNEDAVIKVTGWENTNVVVCSINNLTRYINRINDTDRFIAEDKIDEIFNKLSIYSPMLHETVCEDGQIVPMKDYVNKLKDDYSSSLAEVQKKEKNVYRRKSSIVSFIALAVCAVILVGSFMIVSSYISKASEAQKMQAQSEQALSEFKEKFTQVDPKNGANVELKGNFYEVRDAAFLESDDLKNMYTFTCTIKINGTQYGIRIDNNTSVIVLMKDGAAREYVFGKILGASFGTRFIGPFNGWYDSYTLPNIDINTASIDDIAYIKLTNFAVCRSSDLNGDVLPGTEFELYSAKTSK